MFLFIQLTTLDRSVCLTSPPTRTREEIRLLISQIHPLHWWSLTCRYPVVEGPPGRHTMMQATVTPLHQGAEARQYSPNAVLAQEGARASWLGAALFSESPGWNPKLLPLVKPLGIVPPCPPLGMNVSSSATDPTNAGCCCLHPLHPLL